MQLFRRLVAGYKIVIGKTNEVKEGFCGSAARFDQDKRVVAWGFQCNSH